MKNEDTATALDLADFDTVAASEAGAELQLINPVTKEPLDVFITLLGKDSETYRDYLRQNTNSRIRREAAAARKGVDANVVTAEEIEDKAIELLVVCSTGWRTGDKPTLTLKGETLPFTANNALRVYTEQLWVRRQVDSFVADLENFTVKL
jgi:hypothetical protein